VFREGGPFLPRNALLLRIRKSLRLLAFSEISLWTRVGVRMDDLRSVLGIKAFMCLILVGVKDDAYLDLISSSAFFWYAVRDLPFALKLVCNVGGPAGPIFLRLIRRLRPPNISSS
jgi:hypothetical protein